MVRHGEDTKVSFLHVFLSYGVLEVFCAYLGAAVHNLSYSKVERENQVRKSSNVHSLYFQWSYLPTSTNNFSCALSEFSLFCTDFLCNFLTDS